MNALLFCLFTSAVRKRLLSPIKKCIRRLCCRRDDLNAYLLGASTNYSGSRVSLENTTDYNDEEGRVGGRGDRPRGDSSENYFFKKPRLDSTTGQYRNSLDNSKIFSVSVGKHSMSVGKRVTDGPE